MTDPADDVPPWVASARAQWTWRGVQRPAFAHTPQAGQESVWDYPRPPILVSDRREVEVWWGERQIAATRNAIRVLETAHPPSYYLPWRDVVRAFLVPAQGSSFCEWKGPARYFSLVDGAQRIEGVAWSYPQPFAGAQDLADCVAFYPSRLRCLVNGAPVRAQPGGFYGGWITPDVTGPFKGEPGTEGW